MEIIGGNMTHSDKIVISITLTGEVKKDELCLRSDAKPGDFLFISGEIGFGRAGLTLFENKISGHNFVRDRYLEPKSRLDNSLKISRYVNAMIDVSDGLASEIKHICDESNCGAVIYDEKIPINDDVKLIAKELNEDEKDYALSGGEDFELLFTVSEKNLEKVDGILIGKIDDSKKIKIQYSDKIEDMICKGYDHFSH